MRYSIQLYQNNSPRCSGCSRTPDEKAACPGKMELANLKTSVAFESDEEEEANDLNPMIATRLMQRAGMGRDCDGFAVIRSENHMKFQIIEPCGNRDPQPTSHNHHRRNADPIIKAASH